MVESFGKKRRTNLRRTWQRSAKLWLPWRRKIGVNCSLSFSVQLGAMTWTQSEADSKPKNTSFFIQQVAALPMDVWARRLQAYLREAGLQVTKETNYKRLRETLVWKRWDAEGWFISGCFTSSKNYPKWPRIISTSPANCEHCWSRIIIES